MLKSMPLLVMVLAGMISSGIQAAVTATSQSVPTSNLVTIPTATPIQPTYTPLPPAVNAQAYLLLDANSDKVLVEKNADQRMAPASLTKMMTSYIISIALREGRMHMDDLVPISEAAWRTGGSKMFVKVGDRVPVRDLMQGIIVDSGNDACVAMAEYVAGSQDAFVNLMNQQAALLGMKNTHFMDVNGLPDPQHYTTARDMATLARALIFDFPEDYKWYSQKEFAYNNIKQLNRNRLLWRDASVDGVKTGHTDEAGFCLVASAQRNSMRLISVVMNAPSDAARADASESLLTYGFRFFETHKMLAANTPLTTARIWFGNNPQIPVGVAKDLYITTPSNQAKNLQAGLTFMQPLKAPIKKGQDIGRVDVLLNGAVQASMPLIALQDNPEGSFWQRMKDHVSLWFHHTA